VPRVEQILVRRFSAIKEVFLPLKGSYFVFAKQSQISAIALGESRNVHVHSQGRRDAACSAAIGLEALELM
jgi:hypothetical protein